MAGRICAEGKKRKKKERKEKGLEGRRRKCSRGRRPGRTEEKRRWASTLTRGGKKRPEEERGEVACQDRSGPTKDQPCETSECLTACAAVPAIPAVGGNLEPHALAQGPRQSPALVSVPHGLVPEAATPPPRRFLTI